MLKRILVLDDNQHLLDVVEEALTYEHFQVLVTSDGKNIIEIAKMFQPDLFILDYKMAGHNSEDICRQIKWHQTFGHVPVILSSAYLYRDVDYSALGCDDIIIKPFGLDELVSKVGSLAIAASA
ncbi:MAG: response regulator transcription factor [Bacteroidetes bacterium]|nr:response regulator transcription factor [Bacteroidota bacterium]